MEQVVEKKNYKLRPNFSMEVGKELLVGPCEIELTEEQFQANMHKFEDPNPPKVEPPAEGGTPAEEAPKGKGHKKHPKSEPQEE